MVRVAVSRPLTVYEFQVKTCETTFRRTDNNPPSVRKSVCSKWSSSFWKKSPGKGMFYFITLTTIVLFNVIDLLKTYGKLHIFKALLNHCMCGGILS